MLNDTLEDTSAIIAASVLLACLHIHILRVYGRGLCSSRVNFFCGLIFAKSWAFQATPKEVVCESGLSKNCP